jgi:hypothetical protein
MTLQRREARATDLNNAWEPPERDIGATVDTERYEEPAHPWAAREMETPMNILLAAIIVIGIVLLIVGGANSALNFLIWVGIVLAVIAAIVFLLRVISGRKPV